MAKGKARKHTAKELQRKIDAHKNKGGGKKGIASRKASTRLTCKVCMTPSPGAVKLAEHYAAKHPKLTFNPAEYGVSLDAKTEPAPKSAAPEKKKKPAPKKYPSTDRIRAALVKLYEEKDPSNVSNGDQIGTQYEGKWAKLEAGLSKKFGAIDLNKMCRS